MLFTRDSHLAPLSLVLECSLFSALRRYVIHVSFVIVLSLYLLHQSTCHSSFKFCHLSCWRSYLSVRRGSKWAPLRKIFLCGVIVVNNPKIAVRVSGRKTRRPAEQSFRRPCNGCSATGSEALACLARACLSWVVIQGATAATRYPINGRHRSSANTCAYELQLC